MMIELRFLLRAMHTVAGAAWVGGSIMYLFVVVPALHLAGPALALATQIARLFKKLSTLCIWSLVLSGAYLMFDRLTQTTLGWPYIVVLIVKLAGALSMMLLSFYMGQSVLRRLAKQSTRLSRIAPQLLVILGI